MPDTLYCEGTTNLAVNSLRPRPNRRHFTDDIFKCIFENENEWSSPRISLKFVPKVWINNIPALVQIMAWRRPGDKPLSEPMMLSLLTLICVTRPQWVIKMNSCIYVFLSTPYQQNKTHTPWFWGFYNYAWRNGSLESFLKGSVYSPRK